MIYLSLLLLFAIWAVYFAYLFERWQNRKPNRILYHASSVSGIVAGMEQVIAKYVPATEGCSFIELGAGMGHVARWASHRYDWKEVQAVEIGPVVLTFGKVLSALTCSEVHFRLQDIFAYTPPAGSVLYCYISAPMITKLYHEGKLHGQLVLSLTFPIDQVQPTEILHFNGWQSPLFVYDLRNARTAAREAQ